MTSPKGWVECPYGCKDPRSQQPKFHRQDKAGNLVGCPKAPNTPSEPMKTGEAEGVSSAPSTPPRPTEAKAKGRSGVTFSTSAPEITKGGSARLLPIPEQVDFIVGAERTLEAWNLGLGVVYFGHSQEAAYFEVKPLPRAQFKVSDIGTMTIRMEPRNFYARAVTWVCKRAGAKTVEQANGMLDTAFFFAAFGGIAVALVTWHTTTLKDSPRLKRNKAKKEAKAAAAAKGKEEGASFSALTGPVGAEA